MTTKLDDATSKRIKDAVSILRGKRRLVVFTGAGISKESGIDTFRDIDGLWQRYPVREFATTAGLLKTAFRDPKSLAMFLHDVIRPVARAVPNPAHISVASFERHIPRVDVITQNVDGLHTDAGSTRVHEVHGSLFSLVDKSGARIRRLSREELIDIARRLEESARGRLVLPRVLLAARPFLGLHPTKGVTHRPNVVLFGEQLAEPDWSHAQDAALHADALLLIGTSGLIYPAASIPEDAADRGIPIVGVGPEVGDADVWIEGRAGQILPALLDAMFP